MKGMYNAGVIILSFGIAFLGSYMSITACEQYRLCKIGVIQSRYIPPYGYLLIMSACLGGVGIWCMHFIGMSAVSLSDEMDSNVEIRYDIGLTLASLLLVIFFTWVGFSISSHDRIFMKTKREIVEMFVDDASHMSMKQVRRIKPSRMLLIICSRAPQHLLSGGIFTGCGVVLMHYLGMAAMRFQGRIVWDAGAIAGSCVIAFVAASAAFWILFRLLSIYSDKEILRLAFAFTMAIAVCGMHYTGMSAADFVYDPTVEVNIASTMSSQEAFMGGILAAAIMATLVGILSLADLRQSVLNLSLELYRADSLVKTLPSNSVTNSTVQKYLNKRKINKFNLGVLNDTVSMQDHEVDDNMSVTSDEAPPAFTSYLFTFLCGSRAPSYASANTSSASVNSEGSEGIHAPSRVHPEPERNSARSFQHSGSNYTFAARQRDFRSKAGPLDATAHPLQVVVQKPRPSPSNALYSAYAVGLEAGMLTADHYCI